MAGRKLGTVEGVTPLGEGWGKDIGGGDTAKLVNAPTFGSQGVDPQLSNPEGKC